jgi:hypothetical protein
MATLSGTLRTGPCYVPCGVYGQLAAVPLFFEFGLTVARDGGLVGLRRTGVGEAKRILEAEVGVVA